MQPDELDRCYTALCEAMGRAGEAKAAQFLAVLSLSLLARQASAGDALPLITQAEAACRDAPDQAPPG